MKDCLWTWRDGGVATYVVVDDIHGMCVRFGECRVVRGDLRLPPKVDTSDWRFWRVPGWLLFEAAVARGVLRLDGAGTSRN